MNFGIATLTAAMVAVPAIVITNLFLFHAPQFLACASRGLCMDNVDDDEEKEEENDVREKGVKEVWKNRMGLKLKLGSRLLTAYKNPSDGLCIKYM